MPAKKITKDLAVKGLHEALEAKGRDYVAPLGLGYWDTQTGAPGCLVGHVFASAGVTYDDLIDTAGPYGNQETVWDLAGITRPHVAARIYIDPDARDILDTAQDLQDSQETWGAAVDAALAVE